MTQQRERPPLSLFQRIKTPFHDSADQTAFLTQFIQDSNHLGQMATTIENNGFAGDIAGLRVAPEP